MFGPETEARRLARRIRAGTVVVNDVIVPADDSRLPIGRRRRRGFGVTRGPEGLLEMTAVKAITVRRGRWLPCSGPAEQDDAGILTGLLEVAHAPSAVARVVAAGRLVRLGWKRLRVSKTRRRSHGGS